MMEDRLKRVRSLMANCGYECLLISPGPNQRYLTGLHYDYPGDAWDTIITWDMIATVVLPLDGEPTIIVPRSSETWVREASRFDNVRSYSGAKNRMTIFNDLLGGLKGTLGVEDHLPFKVLEQLASTFPRMKLKSASDLLGEARLVKSNEEIEYIRKAAGIVEKGVKVGRECLREKVTEKEVSLEVEGAMRKQGAESISYCVVQTGAKTATWDPPSEDRVKKGDIFLMDLSATYNGYHADITRVTVIGEPSEKQRKVYDAVKEAQSKAIEAISEGVKAGSVNDGAKGVMELRGFGEFFPFGIGHGLGLEAHEMPHLTEYRNSELVLRPGMVMTIEPTVNLPGEFGMRIEDDILVTAEGRETLTTLGKELVQI
jgi:Xaa-Pro aminopeptidase